MELKNNKNVLRRGLPAGKAEKALVMLHGRGATASGILTLADNLSVEDYAILAPQAADNEWYPYRFIEPVEKNEPWLSNSLDWIGQIIKSIKSENIQTKDIYLLGFSQGACLAAEFAARNGGRYGGIFVLSGGLIGQELKKENYTGEMKGTPVFLGCGDMDSHIPVSRVQETKQVFTKLGASVETRIYEGMGHTINQDGINYVNTVLSGDV